MKLLFVVLCTFGLQAGSLAQPSPGFLSPRVDERVELLSIAYSLAVPQRTGESLNPTYSLAFHKHFDRYSHHPFILYIKELQGDAAKDGRDLGSWEIPSFALHIGPAPKFETLVAFDPPASDTDGWDDRTLLTPRFVSLLRQFCADAKCQTFLKAQEPYYDQVNREYELRGTKLNKDWFEAFFSLPATETYYPVIGLLGIGAGDYIRVNFQNNRRNTHTLFASASFDKRGIPTDTDNPRVARANLHEYVHSFTNQLVDDNLVQLRQPAETILSNQRVFTRMKDTFYGNGPFLLYESLVRACVIQYLMENGKAGEGEQELKAQEKAGFFWMPGLVRLLNAYSRDRQTYRDLSRFMPKINAYFLRTAEDMKAGTFAFPD